MGAKLKWDKSSPKTTQLCPRMFVYLGKRMLEVTRDNTLTAIEAARLKKVSRPTVYAAMAEGRLRYLEFAGHIGLLREDVLAWTPAESGKGSGAKRRGGRPKGIRMSEETKARLSAAQKKRWAERKREVAAVSETTNPTS